ncbi:hypothetical protein ACVIOG_001670 [Rhizobium leguminosarum]
MKTPTRLAVIYGSTREGRICDRVVKWLTQELVRFPQFDIIDPLDFALPANRDMTHPEIDRLAGRLGMADAFIIVTPSFPMAAYLAACAPSNSCGSSLPNSTPSRSAIRSALPHLGTASTQTGGSTIPPTQCVCSIG